MPRDPKKDLRERAERRVREKQARQLADLAQWQDAERRNDFRAQKQVLGRLSTKEDRLHEQRRQELERLDREWQRERDRLGGAPAPAPAPTFGLAPAQRNLRQEYERARAAYETRCDKTAKRFDVRIAECLLERAGKLDAFRSANQDREREFEERRTWKEQDQQEGFEILVHRQMREIEKERRGRSLGEEFTRSRGTPER